VLNKVTIQEHLCSRSYQIEIVYFTWFWKMEKKKWTADTRSVFLEFFI
jgi:hypothetical protein